MKLTTNAVIFIILLAILSCNENDIMNNTKKKNNSKSFPIASIEQDISYSFYIFKSRTDLFIEANATSYAFDESINDYNYAYFSGDAGDIIINEVTLSNASEGSYYSFDETLPLNGNYIDITSEGTQDIPEIIDSVRSPINFAYITSPDNGDEITDNSSLTITWDEENSGMICVIDISARSIDINKTNYLIYYAVDDNGSFIITQSALQNFSKGLIDITLKRGYYTLNQASDDKYYAIAAYTQHTITCKLVE